MKTRVGTRKASKVGNGFKISIPPEFTENWKLKGGEDLIVYADKIDKQLVMIITTNALEGDILGD